MAEFPYREVEFSPDFVYEFWPVVANIAETILGFQLQNKELNDGAAYAALEGLAETYRTLGTGIYYERPPDLPVARALYGELAETLQDARKQGSERTGLPSALKESDIFRLLVFPAAHRQAGDERASPFARIPQLSARAIPAAAGAAKEASRIILP